MIDHCKNHSKFNAGCHDCATARRRYTDDTAARNIRERLNRIEAPAAAPDTAAAAAAARIISERNAAAISAAAAKLKEEVGPIDAAPVLQEEPEPEPVAPVQEPAEEPAFDAHDLVKVSESSDQNSK